MWIRKGHLMINLNHVQMIEAIPRKNELKFYLPNGETQSLYFSPPKVWEVYDRIFYRTDAWSGCIDVAGDMEEEIKSKKT